MPIVLRHDFGVVRPGERYTHQFTLPNNVVSDARITAVVNACSCTTSQPSQVHLPRGGHSSVSVTYSAPSDYRNESKHVTVRTNRGSALWYELLIEADVRPTVSLIPASIDFGRVAAGRSAIRILRIDNFGDSDWLNVEVTGGPDWMKAAARPTTVSAAKDARQSWELPLEMNDNVPCRVYRSQLQLTAIPSPPHTVVQSAQLTVTAVVDDGFRVFPPQLFFPSVRKNESATDSVVIALGDRFLSASSSDISVQHNLGETLSVAVVEADRGQFSIQATLTPSQAGTVKEDLSVLVRGTDAGYRVPLVARVVE